MKIQVKKKSRMKPLRTTKEVNMSHSVSVKSPCHWVAIQLFLLSIAIIVLQHGLKACLMLWLKTKAPFEEFAEDSQPSPEQPTESSTWTKLKWWQQIKPGDKFLDLPSDKWVPCVNLVGFAVWDLIVIRPSKPHAT